MKTVKRSIIKKLFSDDLYVELYKVTLMGSLSNNDRAQKAMDILDKYNIKYTLLGNGTNRLGFLYDQYTIKIALDKDGMVDNRREFKYSEYCYPSVIKAYECTPSGLIAVFEYITLFSLGDFMKRKSDMLEILQELSEEFFIGDVGLTGKNYLNWGTRSDNSIAILDFAYIYDVKYSLFQCTCEEKSTLGYDDNYNLLICPSCHKKWTFGMVRKRITKDDQEKEIGDIRNLGYNMTQPYQEFDAVVDWEPSLRMKNKKKAKKEKPVKVKRQKQVW